MSTQSTRPTPYVYKTENRVHVSTLDPVEGDDMKETTRKMAAKVLKDPKASKDDKVAAATILTHSNSHIDAAPSDRCACGEKLPVKHGNAGTLKKRCWTCEDKIIRNKRNAANLERAARKKQAAASS